MKKSFVESKVPLSLLYQITIKTKKNEISTNQ